MLTSKSEWVYDYASRKAIRREFTFAAGAWALQSETRRVFDGLDVVQERNGANEVTAQLTRDGNIGGILARSTASGVSYFGYDGGGNVTLLTDETGSEVGRYSYDAFGNTLEASGVRAAENPYRFSTKELHAPSGLYDYGYRFYSASLGRWINRDPIQESGGLNLYAMVGNDPINAVDPYGLAEVILRWREVIGGTNHAYLLVYQTNIKGQRIGTPKYFGGYKGNGFSSPLKSDSLNALYGNYLGPKGKSKGSPDWGNPVGSLLMIRDNKPATFYIKILKGVAAKINGMKRRYPPTGATGPNSNSVARTYLNELGIQYPFYSATNCRPFDKEDTFVKGDVVALPYWSWVFDLKKGSPYYDPEPTQ